MSINRLVNDELASRKAKNDKGSDIFVHHSSIASPDYTGLILHEEVPLGGIRTESQKLDNALNVFTKYIPTEVITLYIAALTAYPALFAIRSSVNLAPIYWGFVIVTPVLVWLLFLSKAATIGEDVKQLFSSPKRWPWWQMSAATVAFLIWALAVPNNPYIKSEATAIVSGFGAIFISTILNVLEPICRRK